MFTDIPACDCPELAGAAEETNPPRTTCLSSYQHRIHRTAISARARHASLLLKDCSIPSDAAAQARVVLVRHFPFRLHFSPVCTIMNTGLLRSVFTGGAAIEQGRSLLLKRTNATIFNRFSTHAPRRVETTDSLARRRSVKIELSVSHVSTYPSLY